MNSIKFTALACGLALCCASCSDTTGGHSTPTDATVSQGTAPVQYSEGTPATTVDTTNNRRTEQLQNARAMPRADTSTMPPHASAGSGVSNTTDNRTTTGSSNEGKKR